MASQPRPRSDCNIERDDAYELCQELFEGSTSVAAVEPTIVAQRLASRRELGGATFTTMGGLVAIPVIPNPVLSHPTNGVGRQFQRFARERKRPHAVYAGNEQIAMRRRFAREALSPS